MTINPQIDSVLSQLNALIVGKNAQVLDCVTCLLAGGHLLLEDVPGVGKTTLAHGLAYTFGLQFARVQFTADLMPSDLTGVSVYERSQESFVFHPGPIFSQILLADEINRASPKSQSALLEAMEEQQVSAEGATRPLPQPFFVIATQNPREQLGTYPLPESQLDRFLMRVSLGYPDREAERLLLSVNGHRQHLQQLQAVMSAQQVQALQQEVLQVHTSTALLDYVLDLVDASRSGQWFVQGLSPRAAIAVVRTAKARAFILGRKHVSPEDVQDTIEQTIAHRLVPLAQSGLNAAAQVRAMVHATPLR
ncbi:AAA family ATPase [Lampropedia aestuarii]|uniref:AAA family ATPase n=1 Tax=Lampropedia aestuarii TaxID=2562762 RepID=A0A4S5BV34_9BURK|nr:MoxR family ATPase [Lampropedia aestuarii]MDH5858089.1 MoxR family ATPase [Lampropedia aestuarii]THJ33726.1 AAA family ATPase [Lampropedia aestuarii]